MLQKIHKADLPLRPIVSEFNCLAELMADHLAETFQPIAEQSQSHVKNSRHFIELGFDISSTDILVSFDIVSLLTNIPIDQTLSILDTKHHIILDCLSLIKHCLSNNYFIFQGNFYRQLKGAPMGFPISPVIANIFMEHFESSALFSSPLPSKMLVTIC